MNDSICRFMKILMQLFLKRLIFVSIFLVIAAFALQIALYCRIRDKSVNGQDNLDQTVENDPDVLFLGSSRVLATIDPKIILSYNIKSENLGTHGQGIRFAIARYQNYLAKNTKSPKIIVCSLEPVFESGFSSFMKDRYTYT